MYYTPIKYCEVPRLCRTEGNDIDVFMLQVNPMDKHGFFNFGPQCSHVQGALRAGQDRHRGSEQEPAALPGRLRGSHSRQPGRLHRRGRKPAAHPDPGAAHHGGGQEGGLVHPRGDEGRLLHPARHRRHAQCRGHDDRRIGSQGPGLPHGDARRRLRAHVQRGKAHGRKETARPLQARVHLRPGDADPLRLHQRQPLVRHVPGQLHQQALHRRA